MRYLILFLLIATPAFAADWEHYVVEEADGTLASVGYNPDNPTKTPLEESLRNLGLGGRPYHKVDLAALPPDKDPDLWKWENGKVVVDNGKKKSAEDAKKAKKDKLKAVQQRLNLTDEELELLRGVQ